MRHRIIRASMAAVTLAIAAMLATACGGEPPAAANHEGQTLKVVTTVYPVTYFTERVGGDLVEVTSLVRPGAGAHDFDPSPSDLIMLQQADVIVYNSANFEMWIEQALAAIGAGQRTVIAAADVDLTTDAHGHDHDSAAAAIAVIDRLVHEVEDGHMSAAEALGRIDEIVHDLPSGARNEAIRQIDRIVHEWEDGDIPADEAIERIEHVFHEYEDGGHGHNDAGSAAAIAEIDRLVHEVEDGHMSATDALERVDEIIHDLPSGARDEAIGQIDRIVHEWEDGDIPADEAIERIAGVVHRYEGDGHGHDDAHGHEHDHEHFGEDPHVWVDPLRAIRQVERIRDGLIATRPDGSAAFTANAHALIDELEALHVTYEAGLQGCRHSTFVTTHESFGHMAARYELEQIGIMGLVPEAEPGPRTVARIADEMRHRGLRHVLVEPIVSPGLGETVAAEAGGTTLPLHPLEALTPDEAQRGETYLTIMQSNLVTLRTALDCN